MPIQVLPIHLVNKIAAGEVIERPASVVKELAENAIDAGATRIEIAVEAGGQKLIAISDNGCGMTAADLELAFVPHATSKIATEDDLFNIATMGFRGEALASIASVSHSHIRTGRREADGRIDGHEIDASGERLGAVRPCAAPPGTTVTIRDLFFNTPARRKFMRTVNTEISHVSEQVTRLALPHPQVAFGLTHNGRSVLKLPQAPSTLQRAADVFGKEIADGLLPIANRGGPVGVAGLISAPAGARASAQYQYFFLNGRYIRDRLLSHALKEAYRGLVEPGRFPPAIIFITVEPAEVDVNVHPSKIEVRFRDGQSVHGHLLAALRETLNRAQVSPSAKLESDAGRPQTGDAGVPPAPVASVSPARDSGAESQMPSCRPADSEPGGLMDPETTDDPRKASVRQAMADFFRSMPAPQPRFSFNESIPAARKPADGGVARNRDSIPTAPVPRDLADPDGNPPCSQTAIPRMEPAPVSVPTVDDASPAFELSPPQPATASFSAMQMFQVDDSYIVAATAEGLVIIDQHAMHERLIYNDLKRRLDVGSLEGQRLLIPIVVTLAPTQLALASGAAELLGRLGIEISLFGPAAVAINQFPTLLLSRKVQPDRFLAELLDKLADNGSTRPENILEELLQMLACKAAVKAGDPLGHEEMAALLARRDLAEKASSCPHGRPTTLSLTLKDLEKQFKRV